MAGVSLQEIYHNMEYGPASEDKKVLDVSNIKMYYRHAGLVAGRHIAYVQMALQISVIVIPT